MKAAREIFCGEKLGKRSTAVKRYSTTASKPENILANKQASLISFVIRREWYNLCHFKHEKTQRVFNSAYWITYLIIF